MPTKPNKTVLALKKAISEDVELQQRVKRIGQKTFKELFSINDIERKILDAYFEPYTPTEIKGTEPLYRTTFDIAYSLLNMYHFTNAQIIVYMFEHDYKIYNSGFEVAWRFWIK